MSRILSTSPVSLPNICVGAPIESPTFSALISPLEDILPEVTPLESTSNRPITFTFDYQLKNLIYYHTEEHTSAQSLLQEMQDEDSFAYHNLVPEEGLGVALDEIQVISLPRRYPSVWDLLMPNWVTWWLSMAV